MVDKGADGADVVVDVDPAHDDPARIVAVAAALGRAGRHADAAELHYGLGRRLVDQSRPAEALEQIDLAEAEWTTAGRPLDALRTRLGRMHVLDDLGRHGDSLVTAAELIRRLDRLEVAGEVADPRLALYVRAAACENEGVALGYLGRHLEAIHAYEAAAGAYRESGSLPDVARCLANRGVDLLELGRAREAMADLQEASRRFDELGEGLWLAKCQGYLGRAHSMLGEHREAIEVLDTSMRSLERLGATAELGRTQLALAASQLVLNLLHEALTVLDSLDRDLRDSDLRHDLADCRLLQGQVLLRLGRLGVADLALTEAAELFADVDAPSMVGEVLIRHADVAVERDQPMIAADLLERSLRLLDPALRPAAVATAHLRLAAHLSPAEAERAAEEALSAADELGLRPLRYQALTTLGRALLRQERVDEAIARSSEAVDLIEGERASLRSVALRSSFLADRVTGYDALVEALVADGGADALRRAVAVADRATAGTMSDLRAGTVGFRSVRDPEVDDLQRDLGALYDRMLTADASALRLLRQRAARTESQISWRRAQTNSSTPVHGSAGTGSDGRSGVDQHTVVVIRPIDHRLLAIVTRGGHTTARWLGRVADVRELLDDLDAQWRHVRLLGGRHRDRLVASSVAVLGRLHDAVLGPISADLGGPEPLFVAASGLAGRVPFHALHDGTAHLIERRDVVQVPAASWAGVPAPTPRRLLAVGVDDPSLPSVHNEVAEVADLYRHAAVLTADAADSVTVLDALPGFDVAHLACHGLHRGDNPLFSSLRLSDRWVAAWELLDGRLDGQTVVLASCESGRTGNALHEADAAGLARSVLAAGAGSVVASMWLADDAATRRLLVPFHADLVRGRSPAAALRSAQLRAIEGGQHPYEWAQFCVFGGLAHTSEET